MDLRDSESLSFSGYTLSVEERAGLEVSMRKRLLEEGLTKVLFWGKICGAEADYLIVYGFGPSTDYPRKQFFFCTTKSFDLQSFPDMTTEFEEQSAKLDGPFRGDPGLVLEEGDEEEDAEAEEDEEGAEAKPKRVRFSEAHRLAHRVTVMDADCSIVPKGAYVVTPTHYLVPNPSFAGLSATEASDMANYFHFRRPEASERLSAMDREGAVKDVDFLDPVSEDEPRGVWSIRVDASEGVATVRSLRWPGFYFAHRLGTTSFAGAYFGDGLFNQDLAFMV